jgi:aldose 1-epimerase
MARQRGSSGPAAARGPAQWAGLRAAPTCRAFAAPRERRGGSAASDRPPQVPLAAVAKECVEPLAARWPVGTGRCAGPSGAWRRERSGQLEAAGYAAHFGSVHGRRTVDLRGPQGARCLVLPDAGSQLASLCLSPGAGRRAVEVLHAPGAAESGRAGLHAGAPVLFPFPGRITHGTFTYRGKVYRVTGAGGMRHPLHGFVSAAPWEVVEVHAGPRGAWVRTQVRHADLGVPAEAFPGSYVVNLVHRLDEEGYAQEVWVRNDGSEPFPFGYGWHPYFRAPLSDGGERGDCVVRLAASARWELTPELVPTGRRLEASGPYDLRAGAALGEKSYDDPYTLVERDAEGRSRADLIDPAARLWLTIQAGPAFQHWVVYAPRTLPAVCLEPYTCVPDAFNLAARGVPTGLLELDPGEEWREALWVSVRPWSG